MSSTLFDEQDRLEQSGERRINQWKGISLLFGVIASLMVLSYVIVSRVAILGKQSVQNRQQASSESLSCQSAPTAQTDQNLSPSFLQSKYYSIPSFFPSSFQPPKIIWLYRSASPSPLQLLNHQNIVQFAGKTNHTLNVITRSNYSSFFMKEVSDQIQIYIERAQGRQQAFYFPGQNQEYVKMMIILYLLDHYGGIYIDDQMTMTEDLSWLLSINREVYVNQIDDSMPIQFFSFHNPRLSNKLQKLKLRGVPLEHYRRTIPALSSHFLVTYPRTSFISALHKKFKELLRVEGKQLLKLVTGVKNSQGSYLYQFDSHTRGNLFEIASSLVLMQKQRQYQTLGYENRLFAIDFYGVRSVNQLYFSHKIEEMMDKKTPENTYYHLARVDLSQLEVVTGKLRFMVKLAPIAPIEQLLQLRNQTGKGTIYRGSFLARYLIKSQDETRSGLTYRKEQEKYYWDKLPRRVWVFWGSGINQSSVVHQLCTRRMRDLCKSSNFTYEEVSKSTLPTFLDNETMTRIETTLGGSPHKIYDQTYSDMVRLALLYKHGGIYLDASFILLEDLSWLVNIPQALPSLIYNRYGKRPKVFMFFNPQYASNIYQTTLDLTQQTKRYHDLAYENNFIAAEPQSQLIKDWMEQFILYHTMEHSEIKVRFEDCGLDQQAWTTEKWSYLYEMDAVKCVVGRKERQLEGRGGGAAEYYGIWSMNGYNGVQKLRGFTNFENPDSELNYFSTLFSQRYVDDVLGYPKHLVKFFGQGGHSLSRFLFSRFKEVNSDSIVGSKLLKYIEADQYMKVLSMDPLLLRGEQ